MPGPHTPAEALAWIQAALERGRYLATYHVSVERSQQRTITLDDVRMAISHADGIERYVNAPPQHGGTCWRVFGPDDAEARTIAVGVEAYLDKQRRRVILVTVIEIENPRKV